MKKGKYDVSNLRSQPSQCKRKKRNEPVEKEKMGGVGRIKEIKHKVNMQYVNLLVECSMINSLSVEVRREYIFANSTEANSTQLETRKG